MLNQTLLKAEIHVKNILSKMEQLEGVEPVSSKNISKAKTSKSKDESISLIDQPEILKNGQLKSFQILGLRWLYTMDSLNINGILADEMGLGKTIQVISLIGTIFQFHNRKGPHLIICPKSVISHWETQFKKWLPMFEVIKLMPAKDYREEALKKMQKSTFNIVLTTYEGINILYYYLRKVKWDYIVIDEALRLKNDQSQFSYVFLLSNSAYKGISFQA